MTGLRVDLRFVEIPYELWVLRQHLRVLEPQIDGLRTQYRTELEEWRRSKDWDPECDHEMESEVEDLSRDVLPRLLRHSFIVSTWAVYEGGVFEIAQYLAKHRGARLKLKDIRAEGFLAQAQLYFDSVLTLPLDPDHERLRALDTLLKVRNAIAHGHGRKGVVKASTWDTLEKMATAGDGVAISHGYIIVGPELTRELFVAVDESLTDLMARSKGN